MQEPSGFWKLGMTRTALMSFCSSAVRKRVQADSLARIGGDLQRLEVQALDDVEKAEVGGRLERDDVARAA